MKNFSLAVSAHSNRKLIGLVAFSVVFISLSLFTKNSFAADMVIPSQGQSIGKISENITKSLDGAASLVTALAYLGALTFAFVGALKWKAYGEQPDRTPLKVPVTYMAIAAILAALPEFLGTGISTIWGGNATINLTKP